MTTELPYRWIKLAQHCKITGDTRDAVHTRRKRHIWTDGVQCRLGPDGNLYVNPEEYNKWVEGNQQPLQQPASNALPA